MTQSQRSLARACTATISEAKSANRRGGCGADCDVQHLGVEALVTTGSAASLQRCSFRHIDTSALRHIATTPAPLESAAVRAGRGSRIRMEGCEMSDNSVYDLSTYDANQEAGSDSSAGVVYTDEDTGAQELTVGGAGRGEVLPLADGAAVPWLMEDDARLAELRAVRLPSYLLFLYSAMRRRETDCYSVRAEL